MALRPPERHISMRVSSGLATSLQRATKSGSGFMGNFFCLGVPLINLDGNRNLPRHGGMAYKEVFLRSADIDDLDLIGIGLPLLVGFPGRHIESQRRLLALRKICVWFSHVHLFSSCRGLCLQARARRGSGSCLEGMQDGERALERAPPIYPRILPEASASAVSGSLAVVCFFHSSSNSSLAACSRNSGAAHFVHIEVVLDVAVAQHEVLSDLDRDQVLRREVRHHVDVLMPS